VLTVPGPRQVDTAARSASERLRRARGVPCAVHPKTLAALPCERCQAWMCEACRAKAPSSHLCRTCAPAVGATQALPVDFGFLATIAIAARIAWRSLSKVLVLNVLAHAAKWLCALPFMVLTYALRPDPKDLSTAELIVFLSAYALTGIIISFFEVVLIPAADITLFDAALRDAAPRPYFESLRQAVKRATDRWRSLTATYLLLLAAAIGSLLIILPFLLVYQIVPSQEVIAAGILFSIPAVGLVVGGFGLAVPAVLLEHRSAGAAFGRAWTLARPRLLVAWAFGTAFVLVGLIVSYRLVQFEKALGSIGLPAALAVAFVADIAWPALLVAAYHGLVAEEARLVGRRS